MPRNLALFALALVMGLGLASVAHAQVFVRAPFVRVQVGGGVWVRAPFVNLWVPPAPIYYGPPVYVAPSTSYTAPAPRVADMPAPQTTEPPPVSTQPQLPSQSSPQPGQAVQVPSLEQFAKTFQPKGGNYEVSILSPVTNQATPVRFTLPDGTPRRVQVRRNEIEFDYGIRHFVRIEFDNDGAMVTSR
jgi:hypothetical protein